MADDKTKKSKGSQTVKLASHVKRPDLQTVQTKPTKKPVKRKEPIMVEGNVKIYEPPRTYKPPRNLHMRDA